MENKDIRWEQRFSNFKKALAKLGEAAEHGSADELSELEKEGLIQRFEFTYELAWKTLQDLMREKGYLDIAGPNPVIEQAFQDGYLKEGETWKKMKKSRELSSHTYNSETAKEIAKNIIESYYSLLKNLALRLEEEQSNKQGSLFNE